MSQYISSNANRFYAAKESQYGQAAPVAASDRFPAVRLHAQQILQTGKRLDKTGTRTFLGSPSGSRRQTAFEIQTYLTSWTGLSEPAYGSLFQAALGAPAQLHSGLKVTSLQGPLVLQTASQHGLATGSAVAYSDEIRFVANVIDSLTFTLNAPFRTALQGGALLAPALTYSLANALPSITLYDYWDPISAVSRVLVGSAIDTLTLAVNGDFHEFSFSGPAEDLLDSTSFVSGSASLSNFPAEPALASFDYSIVPGHLGEVWLGGPASQFFTVTSASVEVRNNLVRREREYGAVAPTSITPGSREVTSSLSLLAQDDAQTLALYAAAKQRQPISSMLQLGQQQGQIMGVFMPQVVPEIPIFDDSDSRLQWQFHNNFAQGVSNDEIFIGFA